MAKEAKYHTPRQALDVLLEDFPDNPFLTADELYAAIILNDRMLNILDDIGMTFTGLNWRDGAPYGLLIVKATNEQGAWVVFIRSRTILTSMVILCRMVAENRVSWKVDKYARI